ncbi:tRNA-specific 2-thiouridylase MnmA [Nymphon striatum]|nr:tRNA-specific 2-thiouridylase MnmA [Nymphon striatum]
MNKQKVIVGMSGGVDSSVAALLLIQQGYEVEGLFMKNWEEDDTAEYCTATEDLRDAQSVSDALGIKLHTVNFSTEYWDEVFEYFLEEYQAGRTPNPDIMCNKEIKFKAFLNYAVDMGADYIATGHYARIAEKNGQYEMLKGIDDNKDQTYFLYTLQQNQLARSLFPVGELQKPEVRRIAEEAGFDTASKKDSTGICFIGERKFKDFLQRFIPAQPGEIVSLEEDGSYTVIGEHQGLMYYTLGQIGGLKTASEDPWFVAQKDLENNRLIAVQGHNHPMMLKQQLNASQLHWLRNLNAAQRFDIDKKNKPCTVEIYTDGSDDIIIGNEGNTKASVCFDEMQRAITPGQSIGTIDQNLLDTCVNSILTDDADSAADLYGSIGNLKTGFSSMIHQLGSGQISPDGKPKNMEATRYALGLLHLEKKLNNNPELFGKLIEGIKETQKKLDFFDVGHENIIAKLADVYAGTISTMSPKIMVKGDQNFLSKPQNAAKIRTLLLAGIRAALLWRQAGELLFEKGKLQRQADTFLKQM